MDIENKGLSSKDLALVEKVAKEVAEKFYKDYVGKHEDLKKELELKKAKRQEYWDKLRNMPYGEEKTDLSYKKYELQQDINDLKASIFELENIVKALMNRGSIVSIEDKRGVKIDDVADFRGLDTENFIFDEETILVDKAPVYVPVMNVDNLKARGFVIDSLRLDDDSYLVAVNNYNYRPDINGNIKKTVYVLLTLDQLVLTVDYYQKYVKAENIKDAERSNKRQEEYWDNLEDSKKERFLNQINQRHVYNQLPAVKKKQVTFEKWITLTWQEKNDIHKFYKRSKGKRLKSWLSDNDMPSSFHKMYEHFIDLSATNPKKGIANPKVWNYWVKFREMMDFKINDIEIQRTDMSESRKKGNETSFGNSNTITDYRDEYGVLLKRQDGSKITPEYSEQLLNAWINVNKVFGNLVPNALKYNLKLSHTAKKLIFSSKAIGVFVPTYHAIGISDKYGDNQFQSTMSHECAHFIDYFIGRLSGKRWATDDFEGIAGRIAFKFRDGMNKPKSEQTKYINSTKECFARALQQYFVIETQGEDAEISHSEKDLKGGQKIFTADNFVNKDYFDSTIKPLIKEFFDKYKEVFKFTVEINDVKSNEVIEEIINESSDNDDINITPKNAKELKESLEFGLKNEFTDTQLWSIQNHFVENVIANYPKELKSLIEIQSELKLKNKEKFNLNLFLHESSDLTFVKFRDNLINNNINLYDLVPEKDKKGSLPNKLFISLSPSNENLGKITDLFVGNDDLRPSLNGVFFDKEQELVVATNSHILLGITGKPDVSKSTICLMGKHKKSEIKELKTYGLEDKELDKWQKSKVNNDGCWVVDSNYPKYDVIVPRYFEVSFVFDASKLVSFCNSGKVISNKETNQILLTFDDEGNNKFIQFNYKLLLSAIKGLCMLGHNELEMLLVSKDDNKKAVVIIPKGKDREFGTFIRTDFVLVMPTMISYDIEGFTPCYNLDTNEINTYDNPKGIVKEVEETEVLEIEEQPSLETQKEKYPIVLEWSEGFLDSNLGFNNIEELEAKLKTSNDIPKKGEGYSKNKIWFGNKAIRVDISESDGDYNPKTQNLYEWLEDYDKYYDYSVYLKNKPKNDNEPDVEEAKKESIEEAIGSLKTLLEFTNGEEAESIKEAIESLEILIM